MLRVNQTPEHVRVQIKAREIKKEHAPLEFRKLRVENSAVLRQHRTRLLEILPIIENTGGKRLGVLGNSLGVEFARFFRQIA